MVRALTAVSIGLTTVVVAVACGGDKSSNPCVNIFLPGTRVLRPGIVLTVRNQQGQASAGGTTVTAALLAVGGATFTGFVEDSGTVAINVASSGGYDVRVSRPFYRDTTLRAVAVLSTECGDVQSTNLPLVLATLPDAPAVRSVSVYSTTFLATPGTQAHLVAVVDADAGVSRAVTWQLSDTLLARIDQSGVVTGKCTLRGGTDTVFATSQAAPTVRGKTTFGVGANSAC